MFFCRSLRFFSPSSGVFAGVLASSGMIAGEGLAGVAIAFVLAAAKRWETAPWSVALKGFHFADRSFSHITGIAAVLMGTILVVGLCVLLYRAGVDPLRKNAAGR